MSVDILAILRDGLVLGYIFVLRIAVPLLITLMIGAWLRKVLEEKEPASEAKPVQPPQAKQAPTGGPGVRP